MFKSNIGHLSQFSVADRMELIKLNVCFAPCNHQSRTDAIYEKEREKKRESQIQRERDCKVAVMSALSLGQLFNFTLATLPVIHSGVYICKRGNI